MDISSVDICNMALLRINQGYIASLDDDKPQAVACKKIYDYSLRALMSKYPWNFLRKSIKLKLEYSVNDDYKKILDRYDARIVANPDITENLKTSKQRYIDSYNSCYFPYNCLYLFPDDFLRLVDVLYKNQSLLTSKEIKYDFHTYGIPNIEERENGEDIITTRQRYGLVSDYSPLFLHYVMYADDAKTYPVNFIECLVLDLAIKLTKQFNDNLQFLQGLTALYEDALSKAKIEDCQQITITYNR